ncbi:hypothetical protein ACEK07_52400, partial [Alcanivoracaceae bacterium MT1]
PLGVGIRGGDPAPLGAGEDHRVTGYPGRRGRSAPPRTNNGYEVRSEGSCFYRDHHNGYLQ